MLYNTWQPAKIQHSKSQSFIIYIDSEFTITICKAISNVTYQDTPPQTKIHAGPLIIYDDICSVIQRAVFVTPNILLLYPTQHHCHPRQHTLQVIVDIQHSIVQSAHISRLATYIHLDTVISPDRQPVKYYRRRSGR